MGVRDKGTCEDGRDVKGVRRRVKDGRDVRG